LNLRVKLDGDYHNVRDNALHKVALNALIETARNSDPDQVARDFVANRRISYDGTSNRWWLPPSVAKKALHGETPSFFGRLINKITGLFSRKSTGPASTMTRSAFEGTPAAELKFPTAAARRASYAAPDSFATRDRELPPPPLPPLPPSPPQSPRADAPVRVPHTFGEEEASQGVMYEGQRYFSFDSSDDVAEGPWPAGVAPSDPNAWDYNRHRRVTPSTISGGAAAAAAAAAAGPTSFAEEAPSVTGRITEVLSRHLPTSRAPKEEKPGLFTRVYRWIVGEPKAPKGYEPLSQREDAADLHTSFGAPRKEEEEIGSFITAPRAAHNPLDDLFGEDAFSSEATSRRSTPAAQAPSAATAPSYLDRFFTTSPIEKLALDYREYMSSLPQVATGAMSRPESPSKLAEINLMLGKEDQETVYRKLLNEWPVLLGASQAELRLYRNYLMDQIDREVQQSISDHPADQYAFSQRLLLSLLFTLALEEGQVTLDTASKDRELNAKIEKALTYKGTMATEENVQELSHLLSEIQQQLETIRGL
jgi:hypothetical protein